MGVLIIDMNTGETVEDSDKSSPSRWQNGDREMGERPREDNCARLPFGPAVTPGLQEVPVTPATERKRGEWHPGLIKTPTVPARQKKEPVFH